MTEVLESCKLYLWTL